MYLGVDVGGTKTLVAVLDKAGVIIEEVKFPTPKSYDDFLAELRKAAGGFKTKDFKSGGVGMPATSFDRKNGIGLKFGNLPWIKVPMQADVEQIYKCPIAVENDAKLAGLSEYMLLKDKYHKVLYITVSTGIGIGLVVDGKIDTSIGDGGGRTILLDHQGKMMSWEDFAGGRAIVERFGKKAEEITDEDSWRTISHDLAKGLIQLIAIMQPEVIVIGGSVGVYFDRYSKLLAYELEKYQLPLIKLPVLRQAKRPEQAVVYGCYDLAKQVYGRV